MPTQLALVLYLGGMPSSLCDATEIPGYMLPQNLPARTEMTSKGLDIGISTCTAALYHNRDRTLCYREYVRGVSHCVSLKKGWK